MYGLETKSYSSCLPDPAWKLYWQEPVVVKDAGKPENNFILTLILCFLCFLLKRRFNVHITLMPRRP